MVQQITPRLDLNEIQGDVLIGMQKNAELFIFLKIRDVASFKALMKEYVVGRVTSAVAGLALGYVRVEVPKDAELQVGSAAARLH